MEENENEYNFIDIDKYLQNNETYTDYANNSDIYNSVVITNYDIIK